MHIRTIQFIGGGKMGEALARGVVAAGEVVDTELLIVEPSEERRRALSTLMPGVGLAASISEPTDAVISVKPQHVIEVAEGLASAGCQRILSIAAGVTTAAIEAAAPGVAVVRCMPNTPSLVGAGAGAIAPGAFATDADLDWAESILSAVGVVVRLEEAQLDAVTGLSGSGPAYVFRLAEALIAAGIDAGLTPDIADQLARQTILGAGLLLVESGEDPGTLRENVTSPGGTTAAGLAVLDDHDFVELIGRVVAAAVERSRELGS